jgi:hypothetical protein
MKKTVTFLHCIGLLSTTAGWTSPSRLNFGGSIRLEAVTTSSWFSTTEESTANTDRKIAPSLERVKAQVLQLGAALDRGQSYNPTSGSYYEETMKTARGKIQQLLEFSEKIPSTLEEMEGEWELILTTVPHGIFRSSPFFLAIQESYEYAEDKSKCTYRR